MGLVQFLVPIPFSKLTHANCTKDGSILRETIAESGVDTVQVGGCTMDDLEVGGLEDLAHFPNAENLSSAREFSKFSPKDKTGKLTEYHDDHMSACQA